MTPSTKRIHSRQLWRQSALERREFLRVARRDVSRQLSLTRLEDRWVPAPIQFFYVPMPEQQGLAALETIGTGSQGNDATAFINITASQNNTIITYDHWEDGYEANLGAPLQKSTLIWGDNNPANGIPPGFATDKISAGQVIRLRNDLPANPRDPANIFFDGGDRIGASGLSVVSHGQFSATTGSVLTTVVEVRDTRYFDTKYTAPVGIDTANAGQMFEYAAFFVLASQDNTTVQIDLDNNGTFDQSFVLSQGQSAVSTATVKQGARVVASKPVEVNLLTGDIDSGYGSRSYTLYSDAQLSNDYFTPVGLAGAADPIRLYVYNPNAAAITVNFETQTTSGNFKVAAGLTAFFDAPNFLPNVSGTRLFSASNFVALGTHDQQDVVHDWGFNMQPVNSLTQIALVALGVGNSNNPPSSAANTSPVWVTPIAATRVYADWDGDPNTGALTDPLGGKFDQFFDLAKLQSQRVYDTNDNDNSGMRLYTVSGVAISTAWGEDITAPTGSPGFDAGTSVLAVPVPEFIKFSDFAPGGDRNGDGFFNSGDTVRYGIRITNNGTLAINNAKVFDVLPPEITYILNSSFLDSGSGPVSLPDSGATAFPLDETGFTIASLAAKATVLFSFDVTINNGLPSGTTSITNYTTLAYDIFTLPAVNTISLRSFIGDFVWDDQNGNGIQDVGEPGFNNVTVNLLDSTNTKIATTTTNGSGFYSFSNLIAGKYTVEVTAPPGCLFSPPNKGGNANLDSNIDPVTGRTAQITLGDGEVNGSIDAGILTPSSIAGFIYIDANNNGLFELGETPSKGINVQLTGTDDLGNAVSVTKTTLADGSYLFDVLRPGTYKVAEITEPAGTFDGKSTPGTKFGGTGVVDAINNIVVTPNGNAINYNVADLLPSSLSGFVWEDANNNGTFDGGEVAIKGASVQLTGKDDTGTTVTVTVTTDAAGKYQFINLRPSDATGYTITETTPAGYLDGKDTIGTPGGSLTNDVISKIVLNPGVNGTNNNFAELKPASLTGFIYLDPNNNGLYELGETPSAGIDVQLSGFDDLGNKVTLTAKTIADGSYSFFNLRPGTYDVTEITEPANTIDGKSTPGIPFGGTAATDAITGIVITPGTNGNNYNIADIAASSLSGFVYADKSNDGKFDVTESGIGNATVKLSGTDINSNPVSLSATTKADGSYTFTGLLPGKYTITEVQPVGFFDGKDSLGTQGGTLGNDTVSNITLVAGTNGSNNNFGELPPASISGFLYLDANDNGLFEFGEMPSGGIDVQLTGTDDLGNSVTITKTTLADGSYIFDMLRPGTYKLTQLTEPANSLDGKSTPGMPFGGTGATDVISNIVVTAGNNGTNYNIADVPQAGLSGFIWEDADNDGIFDVGETPIVGASVQLSGFDNIGNLVLTTAMTDALGKYQFTNLRPSDANGYVLIETTPTGYLDGKDTIGTPGGTPGNDIFSNIVLKAGVNGVNNNFAELKPASISGFMYIDANNNGLFEFGESPSGGINVQLTGTDDLGGMINVTKTTLPDGSYLFDQLRPGTYRIAQTSEPANTFDGKSTAGTPFGGTPATDAIDNIAVTPGNNGANYNIADINPSSLSGFVWDDLNNNGVFDAGEAPIVGAQVTITGKDDLGNVVSFSVNTDGAGKFDFKNLRPSDATGYTITETQPGGFLDGKDSLGTQGGTLGNDIISKIVLGPGITGVNNNFAELTPASLGGFVYIDANNNGVFEFGETPSGKIDVQLTGKDDLGNMVSITKTTMADGSYLFDQLRPGSYTVTEITEPAGTLDGKSAAGTPFGGTPATDAISGINITPGINGFNYNIADIPPGSLSGFVFSDKNNDGKFDVTESGIGGVTINLTGTDDNGNPVSLTQKTLVDGSYSFPNLQPGKYTITEVQPAGFLDGKDTLGTQGGTLGNDIISNIVLTTGTNGANNTFAELAPASVSGFIYLDNNNNGIFEFGETPSGGINVQLTGTDDLNNSISITKTTLADGSYLFDQLRPGSYKVAQITEPANTLDGKSTPGSPFGGTAATDAINNLTVTAGVNGTNYNIADLPTSSLSGFIWEDANNNGIFDVGETPIMGAVVQLTGVDDLGAPVTLSVTTDAAGKYQFVNIRPSDANGYTITETTPVGYLDGKDTVGTPGGTLGNDVISKIVVAPGVNGVNNNFAELKPASISGFIYLDSNNNGKFEFGEPTSGGISVQLTGNDDLGPVNITKMSQPDGSYLFDLLRPGTYKIAEITEPANTLDGISTAGTPFGGTAVTDAITNVVVTAGGMGINYNIADIVPSTLSGFVWDDANNNGIFDAGETPIVGATVKLSGIDDQGNPVNVTAMTDGTGKYTFSNIRPSNVNGYTLAETQPIGFLDGKDTLGTQGGTLGNDTISKIVLLPGTNGTGNNFAELKAASVAGFVYLDNNNNGLFDVGEKASSGIAVQLTGKDDLGNAVNLTKNTLADGSYLFDTLRPGTYTLTEVGQPAGTFDGKSTVGTVFGGTAATNNISGITVTPGANGVNYNFADLSPSSLAGVVFFDPNENGVQDMGEAGIGGVTIMLTGTDVNGKSVNTTTKTAIDGTYSFPGLLGGNYTITETQPTLYADGQDKAGNLGGTVGNDSTTLTLPIGATGTGYTFAEVGRTISGTVFLDRDRDCVIDAGEPGLSGLTVTLRDNKGNVVATTKTVSGGSYSFTEQLLMDYTVDVQLAAGYKAVQPLTTNVTLTNAGISSLNFCETLSTLQGVAYRDFNLDGKQSNASETGIAGITVTLTGTDANGMSVNKSTVTAADGSFMFIDILQGTYTLTETQPPAPFAPNGIYDGFNAVGTSGGTLGAQGSNVISGINLAAGVDGLNYQYGEIPPADPFGFVWLDANNNGIREAGEPGIPSVQVTIGGTAFKGTPLARPLVGSDLPGGSLTVVTDANGKFEFTPMPPGLYTISEKQPATYVDGKEENADKAGPFTVVVTNDSFANIELSPNPVRGPFNFGELASSSLAGSVFLDANQNGVQDGTENGIGGVIIRLTGIDILGQPVTRTYVTGVSGSYSFTGLLPGTYSISETQPGGIIDGPDYIGTLGGTAGNDVFSNIVVGAGATGRSYNFTELVPTQLPSKEQLLASTKANGAVVNGLTTSNLLTSPNFTNSPATTKIAPTTPPRYVATGAGAGGGPHVRVFDFATNTEKFSFFAYAAGFTGGVRVAVGDVNGDGTPDIVTAPGAGGTPLIRIFNGVNGSLLNEFMAFTPSFQGGVYVTTGDVNGDGTSEVIVGAGESGGPHVRIFNGNNATIVSEQYVFIPTFTGGVRVAAGDLNADGKADVIVAAGPGGGPHVKAFSGSSSTLLHEFFAFAASFHGGVFVAAGDVNGDGNSDIITSAGPGGGPHVRARSGTNLAELASFFAYPSNFLGGVTVGAQDINGDGRADIICAPASNLPAYLRIVDAKTGDDLDAFLGYAASFRGGAWVA